MLYLYCSKFSPFWQRHCNQKSRDLLRNRNEADKDERGGGGRSKANGVLLTLLSPGLHVLPSSIPSASFECALQTGHSMSLPSSTELCDLLLARGKIWDLISIVYFTEIMRKSMPHCRTKCGSAVPSLFNFIFRIINQRGRCIGWEIFHFHRRKKGKTGTSQHWLLSEARTIKTLPAALRMIWVYFVWWATAVENVLLVC